MITPAQLDTLRADEGAPSGKGSREPSPSVSALTGFDPSRILAEYRDAYAAANPEMTAPKGTYLRGWFTIEYSYGFIRKRRKELEAMTRILRDRDSGGRP
jgi:hypothetical protein